jgi:hypothetical protein
VTPDQIRQDERYLAAAKEAKRQAHVAIRCLDEGLPRVAVLGLDNALGMAKQALWLWQQLEREIPDSGAE